jgi:hypothetical protein
MVEFKMTASEFLDLSTRLLADMKVWVVEASRDDTLVPADLETLRSATQILERVTLREVAIKPDEPTGHVVL